MKQLSQTTARLYAGLKIKRIATNPAREGTKRHALLEAVIKSSTVEKAYATPVKWNKRTLFPASADVRFAVANSIVELI